MTHPIVYVEAPLQFFGARKALLCIEQVVYVVEVRWDFLAFSLPIINYRLVHSIYVRFHSNTKIYTK